MGLRAVAVAEGSVEGGSERGLSAAALRSGAVAALGALPPHTLPSCARPPAALRRSTATAAATAPAGRRRRRRQSLRFKLGEADELHDIAKLNLTAADLHPLTRGAGGEHRPEAEFNRLLREGHRAASLGAAARL